MARIRSIRPEICTSLDFAQLTAQEQVTYMLLWTHLDDKGRCPYLPLVIKGTLYPLAEHITSAMVKEMIDHLVELGMLMCYAVDGREYLWLPAFATHQKPQKPQPSKYPAHPLDGTEGTPETVAEIPKESAKKSATTVAVRDHYGSDTVALQPVVGVVVGVVEEGNRTCPDSVEATPVETVEPKKRLTLQDILWDSLVMVCGFQPDSITSSMRGSMNKALKDLRAVGATPDEVAVRAARYVEMWPNATLTPAALAKNWALLGADTVRPSSGRAAAIAKARAMGA